MTDVTVVFLEVGQGDCTIAVDHGTRSAIMIDCPSGKAQRALNELALHGTERLDLVVATHSDLDHLGGIYPVVSKFPTATLRLNEATVLPADPGEKTQLTAALRAISGLRYGQTSLQDARRDDAGIVGQIHWRILTPTKAQLLHAQGSRNPNHASVVLRLEIAGQSLLIAGDADAASWRELIDGGQDLRACVLLFPHHGAELVATPNGAGADEVLDAVGPDVVVLSFGTPNAYGHPHPATLELFNARAQRFLSTTARFAVDGGGIQLAA